MIYFMRPKEETPFRAKAVQCGIRPIKIGYALRLTERLKQLRSDYRRPDLAVVGVMPGGFLTERQTHERFDHLRCRLVDSRGVPHSTEWFRPGDDLLEFIGGSCRQVAEGEEPKFRVAVEFDDRDCMIFEAAARRLDMSVDEFLKAAAFQYIREKPGRNLAFPLGVY